MTRARILAPPGGATALLLAFTACSSTSAPPSSEPLGAGIAAATGTGVALAAPGLSASEVPAGLRVRAVPCEASAGPLGATVVLPEDEPRAVAIVEVGAQPWDRWGNMGSRSYNHYRDLAFQLAEGGLAVVVYDKRGTGESPGPLNQIRGRIEDAEAMARCVNAALPGVPHLAIGHSMGTVIATRANTARLGTVLLSPLLPKGELPPGPVLSLRGELDGPGLGEVIPGADHLLMRDGHLAPEVAPRILAWEASLKH